MFSAPAKITFFEILIPLVLSGQKTITIRDESERHFQPGSVVDIHTLETDTHVGRMEIKSVEPVQYHELNEFHAEQEALPLARLKSLIREIYPDVDELYVISFRLLDD